MWPWGLSSTRAPGSSSQAKTHPQRAAHAACPHNPTSAVALCTGAAASLFLGQGPKRPKRHKRQIGLDERTALAESPARQSRNQIRWCPQNLETTTRETGFPWLGRPRPRSLSRSQGPWARTPKPRERTICLRNQMQDSLRSSQIGTPGENVPQDSDGAETQIVVQVPLVLYVHSAPCCTKPPLRRYMR
jgi:hypothetical protein